MNKPQHQHVVLIVEDDPDDRLLIREAFSERDMNVNLKMVGDGEELTEYLFMSGRYADPKLAPRPSIILLDLSMPKKDGREVLEQIKGDPELSVIPIVVMSTTTGRQDVLDSYRLGCTSFITKPLSFQRLVEIVDVFSKYWLNTVELPRPE